MDSNSMTVRMSHSMLLRVALPLVSAAVLGACSSAPEIISSAPKQQIQIDGSAREWGASMYEIKGKGVLAGVQNDSNAVYVCVEGTSIGTSRAMLRTGVTVRFDPGTGDEHRFGIKFPSANGKDEKDDEGEFSRIIPGNELEVLSASDKVLYRVSSISSEREYGIKVALRDSAGTAVFELKVPVHAAASGPSIGTVPDGKLKIDLVIPELRNGGEGARHAGGRGGEGGMGRGGRGGEMGGGGRRGGGESGEGNEQSQSEKPHSAPTTTVSLTVSLHQNP